MPRNNWTREELIVAFNLYCKIPFGRIHNRNPELITLANAIGRSPSALSWKLVNFASLDPAITSTGRSGAQHGSKLDLEVWNEFNSDWERLAYESECLFAQLTGRPVEQPDIIEPGFVVAGKEREATVKVRVNQSFFRAAVLAAYDFRCCISGIAIAEFLNASHIIPWSVDTANRVNPRNGLCLNALLDRAFDRGFLTVTPDHRVQFSTALQNAPQHDGMQDHLLRYNGASIHLPGRFMPSVDFLRYHNAHIFKG